MELYLHEVHLFEENFRDESVEFTCFNLLRERRDTKSNFSIEEFKLIVPSLKVN